MVLPDDEVEEYNSKGQLRRKSSRKLDKEEMAKDAFEDAMKGKGKGQASMEEQAEDLDAQLAIEELEERMARGDMPKPGEVSPVQPGTAMRMMQGRVEYIDGKRRVYDVQGTLLPEREPLREGEQSWRERALHRAGMPIQAEYKKKKSDEILDELEKKIKEDPTHGGRLSQAQVRARRHLNLSDLPPSFDRFDIPPLSAEEVAKRTREVHATYWKQYSAWKEARPEEYQRWLARLEKREKELDENYERAMKRMAKEKADLKRRTDEETLLPQTEVPAFEEAIKQDPALEKAVQQLGRTEVAARWTAYHAFLNAEHDAAKRFDEEEKKRYERRLRQQALADEDPLLILNDPDLNLTLDQRKKVYTRMLLARNEVTPDPYWTDPDPRFEGEYDWKMSDAFVKPPVLPPLHLLRHYSAQPGVNNNFSSLHRFLHYERLRQTMHFLREHKKSIVRTNARKPRDLLAYINELVDSTPNWNDIKNKYPFLTDAFYAGLQHMHLANQWAPKDQQEFLRELHRNVIKVAKMLDTHFNRRNRAAAWILPFPNVEKDNPDEPLKPIPPAQLRRMQQQQDEARLVADKIMHQMQVDESQKQQGESKQ